MDKLKNGVAGVWGAIYQDLKKKLPDHAMHAWFDSVTPVGFQKLVSARVTKSVFTRMD